MIRATIEPSRMLLSEDAYGRAKRQAFVESVIQESNPRIVLDFGCGTGTQLTWPLAEAFPQVSFLGIDSDATTIGWARKQPVPPNLAYATEDIGGPEQRYDMIIASEVLEHVESPDQLLRHFHDRLADDGRLVVTVPNGYGPSETMSLIEHLFTLGGVLPVLRRLKHTILGKPKIDESQALTLAISPHINFFSLAAMQTLLRNAGFDVARFRSRTVFCGFIVEWAIRGPLIAWNARLADRLPAWCASDWMFECVKASAPPATISAWRPTRWGKFRRSLSERRWAEVSLPHR
jgi:2-polyprenyl-3-methyl-5-hydroxy-6-metoxy-1,4-benzoquinol methylase